MKKLVPLLVHALEEAEHVGVEHAQRHFLLQHRVLVQHLVAVATLLVLCILEFVVNASSQFSLDPRCLSLRLLGLTNGTNRLNVFVYSADVAADLSVVGLILLLNFHQSRRKLFEVLILGLLSHFCTGFGAFGAAVLLVLGGYHDRLAYDARYLEKLSSRFELLQRPISKFSNLLIDFFSRQIRGPLAQLDQLFFDALVDDLGRTILHVLLSFSNNILHLKHLFGELLVSILVAQLLIFHGFAAHLAVVSTGLLLVHVHHALSVHNRVEVLEVELLDFLEGILHYPDGVD